MRGTAPAPLGLLLAALLLVPAAGCGSRPGGGSAQDAVEPRAWARSVCRTVRPWAAEVGRLQARARAQIAAAGAPGTTQRELVRLFGAAEEASDGALQEVRTAGVPEVQDGRRVADQFVAALTSARDSFGKARSAVGALPTTDRAAFWAGVAKVRDVMTQENARSSQGLGDLRSPVLDEAFDSVPECG